MGRQANVIFGVHTELVFSPWHDVAGCETVVEDTVCYSVPGPLAGVSLAHRVMQAIIAFLIWGWFPGNCHCARNILIQLYGTWGLWLVYTKTISSSSGLADQGYYMYIPLQSKHG